MTRYAILLATLLGLTACNTMGGVGEDMQDAGQSVEKTAEELDTQM